MPLLPGAACQGERHHEAGEKGDPPHARVPSEELGHDLVLSSPRPSAALRAAWCRSRASSTKNRLDLTRFAHVGRKVLSLQTTATGGSTGRPLPFVGSSGDLCRPSPLPRQRPCLRSLMPAGNDRELNSPLLRLRKTRLAEHRCAVVDYLVQRTCRGLSGPPSRWRDRAVCFRSRGSH